MSVAAQAAGMLRVPFDLGGTAHVAFDQHARGDAGLKQGSGVEQRPAGNNFLRRLHVGNDFFGRQLGAGAQPGHGRGRSHQFQHIAAIDPFVAFSGDRRKFVLVKFLNSWVSDSSSRLCQRRLPPSPASFARAAARSIEFFALRSSLIVSLSLPVARRAGLQSFNRRMLGT